MVKRWFRWQLEDDEYVWEDYVHDLVLESKKNGKPSEVNEVFDYITITDPNESSSGDDEEPNSARVWEHPGSSSGIGWIGHNYRELYIFEEEVYNQLEIDQPEEKVVIEGNSYPPAPKLILNTERYQESLEFI